MYTKLLALVSCTHTTLGFDCVIILDLDGSGLIHIDCLCTPFVHFSNMKISISEARKRLPQLVRHVRKDSGAKIEITVRNEVVAELRGALPEPEPGAAAKSLLALMRKMPRRKGAKTKVSGRVKEYLYGSAKQTLMALPPLLRHLIFLRLSDPDDVNHDRANQLRRRGRSFTGHIHRDLGYRQRDRYATAIPSRL